MIDGAASRFGIEKMTSELENWIFFATENALFLPELGETFSGGLDTETEMFGKPF